MVLVMKIGFRGLVDFGLRITGTKAVITSRRVDSVA